MIFRKNETLKNNPSHHAFKVEYGFGRISSVLVKKINYPINRSVLSFQWAYATHIVGDRKMKICFFMKFKSVKNKIRQDFEWFVMRKISLLKDFGLKSRPRNQKMKGQNTSITILPWCHHSSNDQIGAFVGLHVRFMRHK